MTDDLKSLARNGVLRAAINTGNKALVQQNGKTLAGVSPMLAARLAEHIGATVEPVLYTGAGPVFDDAPLDKWDIGFLAIDPMRATKIAFTEPYHTIEATLAVRAPSPIQTIADTDRAGLHILTSAGSAYDMYLTKTLHNATLEKIGTPPDSFAAFKDGRGDAVAGVRASLTAAFGDAPDIRILPGVLTSVQQAMVLPQRDDPRISALDAFVQTAINDGFITAALTRPQD